MQAILKLFSIFLWAWHYAKANKKKTAVGVGAGVTGAALMFSGVTSPPPLVHHGNTTGYPGDEGDIIKQRADGGWNIAANSGGTGATETSELTDWSSDAPDDGDVGIWDAMLGEYVPGPVAGASLSFDDLTDTTVTSWATGEVPRWNGSALVDSKLASTDLSDFAATIVGDANDILAWNGSAFDDTPFVTAVTSAFGNGTDDYVLTTDGVGGVAWEAPQVGGLLTPDGSTAVTRKRVFDPYDYDASGSSRIEYVTWVTSGTTTFSTKTAAGAARDHDFAVDQGVAIFGAGASTSLSTPDVTGVNARVTLGGPTITFTVPDHTNDIILASSAVPAATGDEVYVSGAALPAGLAGTTSYYLYRVTADALQWKLYDSAVNAIAGGATGLIDITSAGTPTHTMVGRTRHDHSYANGDGKGGFTAASTAVTSYGWNIPPGVTTHWRDLEVPLVRGATSAIVYGRGTSGRQAIAHLDACDPVRSSGTGAGSDTFSAIVTNSGGARSQITGIGTGHGLVADDYVIIRCTSASDTEYDVRALVISSGGNDVVIDHPFTDTASGMIRRGKTFYRDYGTAPALHATKFMPNMANPPLVHRTNCRYWRGQVCYNAATGLLYRVVDVWGTEMSSSSAPTWPTAADGLVTDGEVTWAIEPSYFPVNEPATATPQTLLTKIASVTANTFTTVDAASAADQASVVLACSHNDALAVRECVAAMKAYGRPATLNFGAGKFMLHCPDFANSLYWTSDSQGGTTVKSFIALVSETDHIRAPPLSVVLDPSAIVCMRMMQNREIVEDLPNTGTLTTGGTDFIQMSTNNAFIGGGVWEWAPASGGLSEKGTSYTMGLSWIGGSRYLQENAGESERLTIANTRIFWPSIGLSNSSNSGYDGFKHGRETWLNCYLNYGGSDGDFTFQPKGEFTFLGGEIRNHMRLGSHGLYGGSDTLGISVGHCTIRDVAKFAIQIRAEGGNAVCKYVQLDTIRVENSGAILLGEITTSNRNTDITLTNITGKPGLSFAELRNVEVIGGQFGDILVRRDCSNIKFSSLTCDSLDCRSSDTSSKIYAKDCEIGTLLAVGNIADSNFTNCDITNGAPRGTILNSALYEWVAVTGVTNRYYCKLRDSDRDPGFSTPIVRATVWRCRDTAETAAAVSGNTTLNSFTQDSFYFGNIELQTLAITSSPTTGTWTASFNGAGPTAGIALGATAATVQTALRTLTGLSLCTVSETGSGNNKTYLVAMTGFSGDPPEMTVADTFDVGTITPATVQAYPGFNTYVASVNDQRTSPEDNLYGLVEIAVFASYSQNLYIDNSLENVTFRDCDFKSTWAAGGSEGYPMVSTQQFGTALRTKGVVFENCNMDILGLSSSLNCWVFDLTTGAMLDCDITFNGGRLFASVASLHRPFRANFVNGGNLRFNGTDLSGFMGAPAVTNSKGNVHYHNCRIVTNRAHVLTNATNDSWDIVTTLSPAAMNNDLTYHPVKLELGLGATFPTTSPQVAGGTQYWIRTDNKKLFATETNAANNASPIDITTDAASAALVFMDYARRAITSFVGPGAPGDDSCGVMEGNTWRDSKYDTLDQLTANQNNYQVPSVVQDIRMSSDASRTITGIDAPAAGTVDRFFRSINIGTNDIVWAHEEVEEQTIAISGTPTSGTYTITHTGGTTAGIAWNASAATVQAALRLVPGLGLVTVTEAGVSPNVTHTIKMNGFNSDPAQFTASAAGLDTGAVTPATTVAYTSEWINRIISHTGSDLTQAGSGSQKFAYDVIVQGWRSVE